MSAEKTDEPQENAGRTTATCYAGETIPREVLVELLRAWGDEWSELQEERDNRPLNHSHRHIWEGMCNTQMARIADLTDILKKRWPQA